MKKILQSMISQTSHGLTELVEKMSLPFMSDDQLQVRINDDAAAGQRETKFTREYDRRHPFATDK